MRPRVEGLRLYTEFASWWPLLSAPEDYEEEASFYGQLLGASCDAPPQTVLEIGSGGGNNASHMKRLFRMTLVDPSPGMLAMSRQLNRECEHVEGDMRTLRLGRAFDGVFIHDAICYMTTLDDLRRAVGTAFEHCRAGGAAVFAPDAVRETFTPHTDCGGHDGPQRAMRYLEWTWDPDPDDSTYTVDYAYMLRDASGGIRVEHDRHIEGLFSRADWLRVITDAGFDARAVPFKHSDVEYALEVFVGRRK